MQEFSNHGRRRWGWAGVGASLLLLGACTAYHPVGHDSRVPWAQAGAQVGDGLYRVRKGDTLSSIARRYGIGWSRLAAVNDIVSPDTIYAGQVLRIPGRGEPARRSRPTPTVLASISERAAPPRPTRVAVQEVAAPERRSLAEVTPPPPRSPEPEPTAPTAAPTLSDGVYRVRAGDHLHAIAREYGVPMPQLAALNGLEAPYTLRVGQELQLPVAVAGAPTPAAKPVAHIAAPALSGDGFLWPVRGKVVGRFGQSNDGLRRDGINIAARKGTPVRAAEDGVVVYADEGIRGYGRMILLRHGDDYITTYAHNAALLVAVGDVVRRGQVIARVGDTGSVGQAQLHFELRKGLKPLDPEQLLVHEATEVASSG